MTNVLRVNGAPILMSIRWGSYDSGKESLKSWGDEVRRVEQRKGGLIACLLVQMWSIREQV